MGAYRSGLHAAITNNGAAYGFSLVSTASFGVLTAVLGTATVGQVLLFAFGGVLGFFLIETVGTGLFRDRVRPDPPEVIALGSALSFASVGAAVGVAAGTAELLDAGSAWAVGGFLAAVVYVLVVAVEMVLAERLKRRRGGA